MNVKSWFFNFFQLFKVGGNNMFTAVGEDIIHHLGEPLQTVRVVAQSEFTVKPKADSLLNYFTS